MPHAILDKRFIAARRCRFQGRTTYHRRGIEKSSDGLFGIGCGDCLQRGGTLTVVGIVEQWGGAAGRVSLHGERLRRGGANGRLMVHQSPDGNVRQTKLTGLPHS